MVINSRFQPTFAMRQGFKPLPDCGFDARSNATSICGFDARSNAASILLLSRTIRQGMNSLSHSESPLEED
ncbi:MAG: hypothetical protein ACRC62_07850 [Microcoleus sp.]